MRPALGGERLLLDTHVVIWLLLSNRHRVPEHVQMLLEDEQNELLVSAASVWEIAIKRSLGKLEIDPRWATVLRQLDFTQLPVTAEHSARVEHLPWHHRDPIDRLLVAQAQVEGCTVVTPDPHMADYDVPVLWEPS